MKEKQYLPITGNAWRKQYTQVWYSLEEEEKEIEEVEYSQCGISETDVQL